MAAPTNSTTTLVSIGNREDLEDVIYRVVASQTPFTSMIGTDEATATRHEWQTETLATADPTNASLEGNENFQAIGAPNLTTRLGNICQIFTKTGNVSGTQQAVKAAGRSSELARQKLLKGKELARDMEARFIGNFASNLESGATPRRAAGALAWITTSTSLGVGGANGGYSAGLVAAATNGTQRTFTETQVKAVMATAFSNGATISTAFVGPVQKQAWSGFTGIANIRADVSGKDQATIYAGADVYVSDFGAITIVPHPYGLTRDALLIDPSYWAIATLRAMKTEPLAKTGDSESFQIIAEKTLVARNQVSSAAIRDLL